jgi:hypothetical protein
VSANPTHHRITRQPLRQSRAERQHPTQQPGAPPRFLSSPLPPPAPASQNFLRRAKTLAPSIPPAHGLRRSQARVSGGRGSAPRRRQGERRPRARDHGRRRGWYEAGGGGGAEDAATAGEEAGPEEEGRGGGGQEDAYAQQAHARDRAPVQGEEDGREVRGARTPRHTRQEAPCHPPGEQIFRTCSFHPDLLFTDVFPSVRNRWLSHRANALAEVACF